MINKLRNLVTRSLFKGIDTLWEKWFSRGYDPRRTIIVAGTPRGGTTWLAETLARLPGHLQIFEPNSPHNVAATLSKVPGYMHLWEPMLPLRLGTVGGPRIDAQLNVTTNALLYEHIQRTVAGRVRLSTHSTGLRRFVKESLPSMCSCQRLVVKFIRGNLYLHWILRTFNLKGVLIIRHPCAVVASQLHHFNVLGKRHKVARLELFLEGIRHRLPIYEQYDPSFAKVIRSINTAEELAALEWCIRTIVPLRQPKPHPWFLTVYEGLIEDRREWERLCSHLDSPVPPTGDIRRLSSTSQKSDNESAPSASLSKWRQHLSEKQIDDILRVCSDMGVDFYDKGLYPQNLDKYRT